MVDRLRRSTVLPSKTAIGDDSEETAASSIDELKDHTCGGMPSYLAWKVAEVLQMFGSEEVAALTLIEPSAGLT